MTYLSSSLGTEGPVRHAGRSSAFGGRGGRGATSVNAWLGTDGPVRHAGRSSAFGGRV